MSENNKTLTFIGVALAMGVLALVFHPWPQPPVVSSFVGKPLFEKFTSPEKAARLKIVKYAEDVGDISAFEIAKNAANGLWTVPSHGNYPADAEEQMKSAASSLVGLTVLGIASEREGDHALFGVIQPDKEQLRLGDKGVGLQVSFEDEAGAELGNLIIGKEVKGSEGQRFVRIPRQNHVFVVKLDPAKLSTKFEDWIEKDLLKINALEVEKLRMKDHSVVQTVQGYVAQPRAEVAVSLDANGSQWKLDEMLAFREGGSQKTELLEGQELNKEKLDGLKNALAEVKIADVFHKPKGLDASLKTSGEFQGDKEAQRSLAERGFVMSRDNEIWSANGELQVRLKDGVEYVLRFGNVAGEQEDSKDGKLNRYLFVMARLDESRYPPPKLEALPELPGMPAAAPAPAPEKPATAPPVPASPPPAAENKPAPDNKPAGDSGAECGQDPAADKASEKPADPAATDKPNPPAPAAAPAPEKPAATTPASGDEVARKKVEAERERIQKDNQRKLDAWKDEKGKAESKVRDLNARFAPWYYVISEDVYKKIHLSRSDIIKDGAKSADEGTGLDAFRKLEKEGVRKPPAAPEPGAAGGAFPGGFPGGFPGQ